MFDLVEIYSDDIINKNKNKNRHNVIIDQYAKILYLLVCKSDNETLLDSQLYILAIKQII